LIEFERMRQRNAEIARERREWRKIETAARRFAAVVAGYPPAWDIGDGEGGEVLDIVKRALADRGFTRGA